MLGLTFDKLLILAVIAVVIVGPARLPAYAAKLAQLVKTLRGMLDTAKDRMADEMGPEFQDIDWKKLDPRQYDPRRIIRTALLDDDHAVVDEAPRVSVVRPERKVTPNPASLGSLSTSDTFTDRDLFSGSDSFTGSETLSTGDTVASGHTDKTTAA
jgi:sec-independent protein translocase protein TatB